MVHHGSRQNDRRRTDLTDEIGTPTELSDGELGGLVEAGKGANEFFLMNQHPLSHMLGFEAGSHGIEGQNLCVQGCHGKILILRSFRGYSRAPVERLMHFVTALEHDVVIEIRPLKKAKGEARVMVVSAA